MASNFYYLSATQLLMMYSIVYSYNLPLSFSNDTTLNGNLARLVDNIHTEGKKQNVFNFTTINNVPLVHFGKSKEFDNGIYNMFLN